MKKLVFTFMAFFVMCMASLAMVSCSDDEKDKDDKKTQEELLIGKWVLTHFEGKDSDGNTLEGDKENEDYPISEEVDVIEFDEDGSCHNYSKVLINDKVDYDWDNYGEWSLQGTSLTLLFDGRKNKTVKLTQLTSNILTFEYEGQYIDYDTGETVFYYDCYTYQKVD